MTPPSDRPPTLARELSARAVALEHALEDAVDERFEHGLRAAQASIADRFGTRALVVLRTLLRVLGGAVLVGLFAFGLLLITLRYWLLPDIDAMRPRVEALASRVLKAPVSIGRLEASWQGLRPVLAMNDVRIHGRGDGAALALPRIEGTLSWASLPAMEPRFARMRIHAPEFEIALLDQGVISVGGILIDPKDGGGDGQMLDWLLVQGQLLIRDARVRLRDERVTPTREVEFSDVDFLLESGIAGNRFGLRLAPPSSLAAPFDVRGEFHTPRFGPRSDWRRWSGEVFAQVDYIDLARLNDWVRAPIDVRRAHGALRAWLRFDASEVVGSTADLALKDVDATLARDLAPLRLSSFQGRVTQGRWGDAARGGQQVGLAGVTFVLASGAQFPPLDMTVRYTREEGGRPQRYEVDGSRIELASLAGIATHVPLGRSLREAIARYAPQGQLTSVSVRWDGAEPEWRTMTARARFDQLSLAAQPPAADGGHIGTPGFERLSGTVQFDAGSGSLKLASRDAIVIFPGVFEEPRIALDLLQADIKWKSGDTLDARIDALQLSNADLDIAASGTWKAAARDSGSGRADITGRIDRINARQAFRYVPLSVGRATLSWLEHAIVEGRLDQGTFRLKGDLDRFPFPNAADGDFRAAARLRGAVLDVAPQPGAEGRPAPGTLWPLLRDIDADLIFERQSMTVRAQRGLIDGARIADTTVAHIPDLGHDATLEVRGQVAGELADMLRYVNASPVAEWTANITRGAEARGTGRLDLKLDIPLLHARDARVSGSLQLQNNDLTLADIPPFTRATGVFAFNERGIRFSNIAAGFLGGQARFDGSTRADGAIVITATGGATPAGLKRAIDVDVVQRVLDRSQGSMRYTASLTAQRGTLLLRADTDLNGLAIDGIAPLRKAATETMPLRLERTSGAGDEALRVSVGNFLTVHTDHRRERGVARLVRGVVAVNEPARAPDSGMLIQISVPRFDVEAWSAWLGLDLDTSGRSAVSTEEHFRVDYVTLRTGELVIDRRDFRNVTLGATRTDAGGFNANIASDSAVGHIGWKPGPLGSTGAASLGQVTARLSKLSIPASKKNDVVGLLQAPTRQYPALDVSVENFEVGPTKYGRVDLAAANSGTGTAAAWRLSRLDISNPDMKASATGDWSYGLASARRTRIAFTLDTSDAGATLGRFGIPGAVSRGTGKLEGKLDWAGSPLDLDIATLNGSLSLRVDDGRFMKVDNRGAGRLLTLLSLQSLSRTLIADTRESFGEGFAFSAIKAEATVVRGVMSTDNFSMTGAAAAALISGSVDLRNETQQLHLVVLPEIDASTAALALGVANPVLGLGALLANMVLKAPLARAFAIEYDITGTWNDPVITRRNRVAATPTESVR
jgi:uncharacterized protein (TIGR02099 family)